MDLIQSYDAQVAVLGSLLLEPEKLGGEIMHAVSPDDFGTPTLRNLFRAAREIYLEGSPLDPVTLVSRAGAAYDKTVRDILVATPTAANWEAYVGILKEGAKIDRLHKLAEELLETNTLEAGRKLLAQAEDILTERPGRRAANYTELVSAYCDRQNDSSPPDYLDWGIEQLNRHLSVSPGRFVILGADSSVGKTAFALQLAYNIACTGKRVGFFSYETSNEDAADRILANTADVNLPRTKKKCLTAADWERVASEGVRSGRIPLTVVETAGCGVDDLRTEILAGRYQVVFIDYIQLIPGRASDRWQVVTEVSMALHTMAQQLGVTIIALSQVTPPETDKNGKRRALRKGDLRESRQLINDADVILMMDLTDPNDTASLRVLQVDKNKDGPVGRMYLSFDPEHMRFKPENPPPGESYRRVMGALAEQRREQQAQRRAEKQAAIDGQARLEELPDNVGGPLPF